MTRTLKEGPRPSQTSCPSSRSLYQWDMHHKHSGTWYSHIKNTSKVLKFILYHKYVKVFVSIYRLQMTSVNRLGRKTWCVKCLIYDKVRCVNPKDESEKYISPTVASFLSVTTFCVKRIAIRGIWFLACLSVCLSVAKQETTKEWADCKASSPVRARGLSRECAPPYPQRDRKRRLNGAVCRNHRIKRLVPCRC